MNPTLNSAMKPVASFHITNYDTSNEIKLCLFTGHYNTATIVTGTDSQSQPFTKLIHAVPTPLVNAGYACDQLADDYDAEVMGAAKTFKIGVAPNSARCRYRDFLDYVKVVGSKVTKIRLTNLGGSSHRDQFDKEMEISASAVGSKAGSDFIQLTSYKNPANYDQDVIEIDLEKQNLLLDATTLAFLTIAPGANFNIEFTLDK